MSDTITHTSSVIQLGRPSMWTVVFLNDDFTPMMFVEQVLATIFHKSSEEARQITLIVHQEGKARVGSYTREVASHKADQTLLMAGLAQHPLQVYAERL